MWVFDIDYNKWIPNNDSLKKANFDYLKEEQSSFRFYSKCLSGAVYSPSNNLSDIYDVITKYKPRSWYIGVGASEYSNSLIPPKYPVEINATSSYDYYSRFLPEYGLSLKTLFTPKRLIDDSINYIEVDLATTESIILNSNYDSLIIDGVKVSDGQKILVKDQIQVITLNNTVDPESYFQGNYNLRQIFGSTIEYTFYDDSNGIYLFTNGRLQKTSDLNEYSQTKRFGVYVKSGNVNTDKQFSLSRLKNGYFPISGEPMEFLQSKNWIIRNKVDYNNLFEINYYDVVKFGTQSLSVDGITYSIPERTISVGEFGVILNTQGDVSNIIRNKYKLNLRCITDTSKYYWICGDSGLLLKVKKHDFSIEKITLKLDNSFSIRLTSVSFYDDLRGVVVGDLNTIFVTNDGGLTWKRLRVPEFNSYYYNKVLYKKNNLFWIAGRNGVFIEMTEDISGWKAHKKKIAKYIDDEDEILLVDNINDISYATFSYWGLSYSYLTQSIATDKELLFLSCDDSKIIAYDVNDSITEFEFIYFDFDKKHYNDIINISNKGGTDKFYFTGLDSSNGDSGLFSFNLSDFSHIGIGNSYSNTCLSATFAKYESQYFPNEVFDYKGNELIIAGNDSLLFSSTYSSVLDFNKLDSNFENRLRSKLLFLDYDIASKLNFFTDAGDYRLPNSIDFSESFVNKSGDYVGFNPLIISATFPSFMTQSEVNWWNYWTDKEMTFEYYSSSDSFTESTKVLMSSTFSYSSTQSKVIVSDISNSYDDIKNLAPNINIKGVSRYNGMTGSISGPGVYKDLYIYDYLMIQRVSTGYPVSVGDVMRFSNQFVEGNFVVNKIFATGSNKFIYMYTNFNDNITKNLTSLTASIVNLNVYSNTSEFIERYNSHPMSNAYKSSIVDRVDVGSVMLDFKSGDVSYDGWYITPNFTSVPSFVIGNSTTNTTPLYAMYAANSGTYSIESPDVSKVNNVSFAYSFRATQVTGTSSTISVKGLSGSGWYELYSFTAPSSYSSINTFTASFDTNYDYSKFRFDLSVGSGFGGTKWLKLDDIKLSSYSKLEVSATAYGVTDYTFKDIRIEPVFDYNSAYYNLSSGVNVSGDKFTMSYTSGFLNFGYTPNYNLLSYLEGLNDPGVNPLFFADKEYYSMPEYRAIPMTGPNGFTSSSAYIQYNGLTYSSVNPQTVYSTSNRILFGSQLKSIWDSVILNTFVDIHLYGGSSDPGNWPNISPTSTTEKLLVSKKYYDSKNQAYVIEFNKKIKHIIGEYQYWLDIVSRRKLHQISSDLQDLNNIQRPLKRKIELQADGLSIIPNGHDYYLYESDLNFKLNTDAYTKILLSDYETFNAVSGVIYTDYKGELSLNITKLEEELKIPINNTGNYLGNLFIFCNEKHGLKDDDGVILEFNAGDGSSSVLNQQYFGYQTVKVVNEYNFYVNIPYGNPVFTAYDSGFVKYVKGDPFLGFQPVDLIDMGSDKKGKISIEVTEDNLKLSGKKYYLDGVDFNKFRFRLVDNLTLESLSSLYPWVLEAEISSAVIGQISGKLCWYTGIWQCGRWFDGRWVSGQWVSGDWYNGIWDAKTLSGDYLKVNIDENVSIESQSIWYDGRWYDGTWNNGIWVNGRWYDGTWNSGTWYKGIWNRGTWNDGKFTGGIWVDGKWNKGYFNCDNGPSYWLDGEWYGGDFENGIWYNGFFDEKGDNKSRFGVKSFNSRNSIWHSGTWVKGTFHSKLNLDDNGDYDVAETHKYSIWRTGKWISGEFYGGVAYNMNWNSGTWYGGILEDIEIIGSGVDNVGEYYFTLNGIFKFNIGDQFKVIDNQFNQYYSVYGSNASPQTYIVIYSEEVPGEKWTKVYVNKVITLEEGAPEFEAIDTTLRVVSNFEFCNWKSGIWTNGIYETGLWEGGIWYNGIFEATWM